MEISKVKDTPIITRNISSTPNESNDQTLSSIIDNEYLSVNDNSFQSQNIPELVCDEIHDDKSDGSSSLDLSLKKMSCDLLKSAANYQSRSLKKLEELSDTEADDDLFASKEVSNSPLIDSAIQFVDLNDFENWPDLCFKCD